MRGNEILHNNLEIYHSKHIKPFISSFFLVVSLLILVGLIANASLPSSPAHENINSYADEQPGIGGTSISGIVPGKTIITPSCFNLPPCLSGHVCPQFKATYFPICPSPSTTALPSVTMPPLPTITCPPPCTATRCPKLGILSIACKSHPTSIPQPSVTPSVCYTLPPCAFKQGSGKCAAPVAVKYPLCTPSVSMTPGTFKPMHIQLKPSSSTATGSTGFSSSITSLLKKLLPSL